MKLNHDVEYMKCEFLGLHLHQAYLALLRTNKTTAADFHVQNGWPKPFKAVKFSPTIVSQCFTACFQPRNKNKMTSLYKSVHFSAQKK